MAKRKADSSQFKTCELHTIAAVALLINGLETEFPDPVIDLVRPIVRAFNQEQFEAFTSILALLEKHPPRRRMAMVELLTEGSPLVPIGEQPVM